jgi:hypothetical protein
MQRFRNMKATAWVAAIAGSLVITIGGVTFAALQSQQDTLTGNTIETATANLQLSTDGTVYGNSHSGFDFNNLIPGAPAQPVTGYPVYLRNTGGAPLVLKLAVSSAPSNSAGVDLSKVTIILTPVGTGATAQSFTLQALIAAAANGGLEITGDSLKAGVSQEYKLQVSMTSDAVNGAGASFSNVDFAFSGTAQAN